MGGKKATALFLVLCLAVACAACDAPVAETAQSPPELSASLEEQVEPVEKSEAGPSEEELDEEPSGYEGEKPFTEYQFDYPPELLEMESGDLDSWVGEYALFEHWPKGWPDMNFSFGYSLEIYQEDGLTVGNYYGNGHLLSMAIHLLARGDENRMDLYIVGFRPGIQNILPVGEVLFSLERDGGDILTHWGALERYMGSETDGKIRFTRRDADPAPYDKVSIYHNNIQYTQLDGKYGHIHVDGQVVEPQYDSEYWFNVEYAMVDKDGLSAVIDEYGNCVLGPAQGHALGAEKTVDLIGANPWDWEISALVFQIGEQYGIYFSNRHIVPLPDYREVQAMRKFYSYYYAVAQDESGKYGVIGLAGTPHYIPFAYDAIESFPGGIVRVETHFGEDGAPLEEPEIAYLNIKGEPVEGEDAKWL